MALDVLGRAAENTQARVQEILDIKLRWAGAVAEGTLGFRVRGPVSVELV